MKRKTFLESVMRNLLLALLFLLSLNLSAQTTDWGLNGNPNADSTSFIGTLTPVELKFKTDAVERMVIDPSGKIGIGTSTPTEKLSVNGSIQSFNLTGNSDRIILASPSGTLFSGPTLGSLTLGGGSSGTIVTCPSPNWLTAGNNGGALCQLGTLDYFPLKIVTNGQSRVRIKEDGRISMGPVLWNSASNFQANTLTEDYVQDRHFLGLNAELDPAINQIGVLLPTSTFYNGHGSGMELDAQAGKLKIGTLKNGNHTLKGITIGLDGHTGVGMEPDFTSVASPDPNYYSFSVNGYSRFTENGNSGNAICLGHDGGNAIIEHYGDGEILIGYYSHATVAISHNLKVGNNAYFEGKVMIGNTASFSDNTGLYALNVKGKIRGDGMKVYNSWSDYVFDDNYDLPTLPEWQKFIKKNHHLPGIPSATEVEKEGIDLGPMQAKLLEKIEELTLYVIGQQKEINELRNTVKSQGSNPSHNE